ncbi:TIGR02679 family protein [Kitasatospora sp. NPDC058046]|uniref:TIGR02679 family protein n=1 Tax=Kitasatospora sp. NPDC058046 TaxID=3346312 RepID=UPI0036D89702
MPEPIRGYLAHPSLDGLWEAVRTRLERNSLAITGVLSLVLDETGARRLGGLLGTSTRAGTVRVPLAALDAALRSSSAGCSLITAVTDLTGSALRDRRAERRRRETACAGVWTGLEDALEDAGLAHLAWVPAWREQIRAQGLLTRAGPEAGREAVGAAVRTLAALAPALSASARKPAPTVAMSGLAQLAARATADAHGLDDGRLAGTLVLRAIAAAHALPWPADGAGRRQLWERVGIAADQVSGTALVLGLRPPGDRPWPGMLRARAGMGLVTHLTLSELTSPVSEDPLVASGQIVHVCENPQVLQAAAQLSVPGPLVCTSGMPSSAGWHLLERLHTEGAILRYHGDFDWPGIAIAARILHLARPWRLCAEDYRHALTRLPDTARLPLAGAPAPTPWDPVLADAMHHAGYAVHEETVLPLLLKDLQAGPAAQVA